MAAAVCRSLMRDGLMQNVGLVTQRLWAWTRPGGDGGSGLWVVNWRVAWGVSDRVVVWGGCRGLCWVDVGVVCCP